jgi:hypothetical protein
VIEKGDLRIEEEELFQRIGWHGQPKPRESETDATMNTKGPRLVLLGAQYTGEYSTFPRNGG